ncbi:hypothetical protein C461_01532 [Halorubrum aidingense JCM 13560]|uniref:DUF7577 domain-containing protein n=1 Tax=Halorubrum aidingense JCM 13560 TaxID=1230454 RepID=M0PJ79_9EURY|nr:zinc ribbon domain-containing protein [Halorubrum aidingense]EMA70121.1 hypothetical protein C461_01532 [Halorubrum aidingense JCM 13560]
MTGGHLVPIAAILATVVLINLVITWLLVRWDRDPAELLGAARYVPEDDEEPGSTTLRTTAGTERHLSRSDPDDGPDPPPLDVDGDTVVCRHCNAENRPGYRYCRWCVRSGFVDDEAGAAPGSAMTEGSF